MIGLLYKIWRETRTATLLFALGLLTFEVILTRVMPQVQEEFLGQVLASLPFIRPLLTAMLGIDLSGGVTSQVLQSFVWVHPAVLALLWAQVILFATRVPAGEIDRGTIDVLLGWPLSRRQLYLAEGLMWLVSIWFVLGVGLIGQRLAVRAIPEPDRASLSMVLTTVFNLFAMCVAVGGVGCLISALSDRRGRAVGAVFGIVLASFFWNFLAQFWQPAETLSFFSVLHYYRPANIVMESGFPVRDVLVLLGVGLSAWIIGGEILARRSICTV